MVYTKIITREDAKKLQLRFFFTGRACVHGHMAERYTSTRACRECHRLMDPIERAWRNMLNRTHGNPDPRKNPQYPSYGGRGIQTCAGWRDPETGLAAFRLDMGIRPPGCSLERFNNDGDYEPSNCLWATQHRQRRNRRCSRFVKIHGRRVILADVARFFNCSPSAIYNRAKLLGSYQAAVNFYLKNGVRRKHGTPQRLHLNGEIVSLVEAARRFGINRIALYNTANRHYGRDLQMAVNHYAAGKGRRK